MKEDKYFLHVYDYDHDGKINPMEYTIARMNADAENNQNNSDASNPWVFNFGVLIAVILFFKIAGAIGGA